MNGNYSPSSQAAQLLARCGALSLWLGWIFAILLLLCALTFVLLLAEPLPHRLMSLTFLGVLPALTAATIGWVMARLLRLAASICDQIIVPHWQRCFQSRNAPYVFPGNRLEVDIAKPARTVPTT
jgi:hypothetical protein